jgi:ribosomal protein S12 methylthiotransferase accessory factor YcaO
LTAADDPMARAEAKLEAVAAQSAQSLPLGRSLIRMTADEPRSGNDEAPTWGLRRTPWIEEATEPLRDRLTPEAHERLVPALAVVVGWKALIVLEDVRGLDPQASTTRRPGRSAPCWPPHSNPVRRW